MATNHNNNGKLEESLLPAAVVTSAPSGDTRQGDSVKADARIGNSNALRHGLRGGRLPKDARYIELRLNEFRRTLEAEVLDAKGEVSLIDAGIIQTCLRWERHACLAQRWLTKKNDELKPEQLLHFSREVARASAERDKALAMLKIDKRSIDHWAAIDNGRDMEADA